MGIQHEGEILLTTAEVAGYLGVGTTTVARLCDRGVLIRRKVPDDFRLFVTLDSMLNYRKADKFTVRELAARLLSVEDRLNEILATHAGVTYQDRGMGQIDELLIRNHPNTFPK